MFRKMRRFRQALSEEECREVLKKGMRGILSVLGEDGYPYGVPLNYDYDEDENRFYFHGAREGHKVDAIKQCDKVSFCVYDEGYREEGDWALYIKSVIVFGRIRMVEDEDEAVRIARQIGLKYNPDAEDVEEEIRRSHKRLLCLELLPEHMSGKLVHEK